MSALKGWEYSEDTGTWRLGKFAAGRHLGRWLLWVGDQLCHRSFDTAEDVASFVERQEPAHAFPDKVRLEIVGGAGVKTHPERGPWMQTWVGAQFYPLDPRPQDIDILDIAFALSNIGRYGGHCRFYSVAEHSYLVSHMVPEHLALEGLMHDAAEAYLGDVVRPLKQAFSFDNEYFDIERNLRRVALAPAFGLSPEIPHAVVESDVAIVEWEKAALHPRSGNWEIQVQPPKQTIPIRCLEPNVAAFLFLNRYCELTGEDFNLLSCMMQHLIKQDLESFYNVKEAA